MRGKSLVLIGEPLDTKENNNIVLNCLITLKYSTPCLMPLCKIDEKQLLYTKTNCLNIT